MSRSARRTPVARWRVLVGFIVAALILTGIIAGAEMLRPPAPEDQPLPADEGGDPRDEVTCPDPVPREDLEREDQPMQATVSVGSSQLYDCPQSFDGAVVRFRGEVVGAVLWRRDGAWVQLNDDIYADPEGLGPLPAHRDFQGANSGVGVHLPTPLAEEIAFVGGPDARGDLIEVEGVFHRVDEASEVTVIRAQRGSVVASGRPIEHPPLRDRQLVALLLVPLALLVTWLDRRAALRT